MKKIIVIVCVLMLLPACSSITEPKPWGIDAGMQDGAPAGSNSFRTGFKEGCDSGMSASGDMYYKSVYSYEYNANTISDVDYTRGWSLGFRHCRRYTAAWLGL